MADEIEKPVKRQYLKRSKKFAQERVSVQDSDIQVIMLTPHIGRKKTTDVVDVDYKAISQEECMHTRLSCPYARRKNSTDSRFHDGIQQDFYESVLLKKKPKVVEMWIGRTSIALMDSPMSMQIVKCLVLPSSWK